MRSTLDQCRRTVCWTRLTPWWPVVMVLCAAGLVVVQALHLNWKNDDAYIAFAYAQNWVQGHGLVFNVGERVEGYTCFLWVALSALGLLLGVNIEWWSTALGVLSAVALVLVTWRFACELLPPRLHSGAVASALLLGAYPPLAWWAVSGMETALFTCLVTVALWRHVRDGADSAAAPVALALASLTRPEGWLLAAVLCLDAVRTGSWRRAARYVGLFLAIFVPYYAWRCWYYGYPLPNTFYAKVGGTSAQVMRGLAYLRGFLITGGGALLIAPAMAAVASRIWRRTAALYVFLIAYLPYVVLVGGDVFPYYRFLIPIVPVLSVLAVVAILRWSDRLSRGRVLVGYGACTVFAAVFLIVCLTLLRGAASGLARTRILSAVQHGLCRMVKERTRPDDAIATVGIGVIKFCTGRTVIDMVGLTDRHIAHQEVASMGEGVAGHEKYDSQYVLARWPKYIMIPGPDYRPRVAAVEDMWGEPTFRRFYVKDGIGYRRIEAEPGPGKP